MKRDRVAGRVSRRHFLRGGSAMVGGLAAPQLLGSARAALSGATPGSAGARQGTALRLGVLVPHSGIVPELGAQLLAGLELGFAHGQTALGGRSVDLLTRASGVSDLRVARDLDELLAQQPDLIVGVLNSRTAGAVRSRLAASRTGLIALGMGENLPRGDLHGEWVLHNSLLSWQAAWAMGAWAARQLGSRAVIAASFYDSGYDSLFAFQHGFESAGGTVSATRVTHVPHDANALAGAITTIEQLAPDVVYGSYCGSPALDFVRAYADAGLAERVPLLGSAFMVDEALLPLHGAAAAGIRSCLPWAPGLRSLENEAFITGFRERTGRAPDLFALLGYETARIIASAVDATGGSPQRDRLHAALRHVRLQSPRGSWRMDAGMRTPTTPLLLREVRRQADGFGNVVLAELAPPAPSTQLADLLQDRKSGWVNPYLVV